jgi:ATP-dependent exoDNAse (exonuclease V) beta subunit
LQEAKQIYREIPFVYRSDKRIIHGILDVLFQRQDGSWVILDYKTSHVKGYKPGMDEKLLSNHALRYHLQIGVYGAAVQEQLGGICQRPILLYSLWAVYVLKGWSEALRGSTIGDLLTE